MLSDTVAWFFSAPGCFVGWFLATVACLVSIKLLEPDEVAPPVQTPGLGPLEIDFRREPRPKPTREIINYRVADSRGLSWVFPDCRNLLDNFPVGSSYWSDRNSAGDNRKFTIKKVSAKEVAYTDEHGETILIYFPDTQISPAVPPPAPANSDAHVQDWRGHKVITELAKVGLDLGGYEGSFS